MSASEHETLAFILGNLMVLCFWYFSVPAYQVYSLMCPFRWPLVWLFTKWMRWGWFSTVLCWMPNNNFNPQAWEFIVILLKVCEKAWKSHLLQDLSQEALLWWNLLQVNWLSKINHRKSRIALRVFLGNIYGSVFLFSLSSIFPPKIYH